MDFHGQRHRLPAELPRLDGVRQAFADFLRQLGAPADEVSRWELVLVEAATNAILHGSGGNSRKPIDIAWSTADAQVCLEVGDSGQGLATMQPRATLPADPLQTSGRGLYLIHESCDDVQYWHGAAGFRLVMTRKLPAPPSSGHDPESLMQAVLMEISQCYESLAAFYRLGDALIAAERLPEFFLKAVGDIAKVVPHDRLRLTFSSTLQPELRASLRTVPFVEAENSSSPAVERVLRTGHEFVWQEAGEVADDVSWRGFACGAVMPLRAGGKTLGALTLARRQQPYLVAAELSTVRTYVDVFGIALANANNALVREREQSALRELEIAATTQAELLPLPPVTEGPGWRAVVRRQCALSVAGDYVDICPTPDGGWLLAMVDVMGKGMSAALFAGMVRTALRIYANTGRPLAQLILDLNCILCAQTGELTLFATCALARLSPALDRAQIVNAGHCPVFWLGSGGEQPTREFAPSGPPLGLFMETAYAIEDLTLAPGDRIIMVTDGLYENGRVGQHAGSLEQLAQTVRQHGREGGEALWNILRRQIQPPAGESADIADDQTLLVWERHA